MTKDSVINMIAFFVASNLKDDGSMLLNAPDCLWIDDSADAQTRLSTPVRLQDRSLTETPDLTCTAVRASTPAFRLIVYW